MTTRNKLLISFALLLVTVVAGAYLSGFILLLWLGMSDRVYLGMATYFSYVKQLHIPKYAYYALQIKTSGFIGFGAVSALWLSALILLWKRPSQSLHGEARFSGMADLAKAGFFKETDTSVIVGKSGGKLLHYSGQQFALLAAPTRSGKGVGIVIPNLLHYKGSVVVLDIKQENFKLTSGYRKENLGQEVYLFNPFAED